MDPIAFITDIVIPTAHAQGPCWGVPCGAGGNPLPTFVSVIASVLVEIVAGLSVLFVAIGGALLVMNMGNESQADKGKKAVLFALIGYAIALSSQTIISFAVARSGQVDADMPHLDIMRIAFNSMLLIFNIVFALMAIFFGYKLVISRGQQGELDTVKKSLAWTVSGAIIINLSYVLVRATSGLGF